MPPTSEDAETVRRFYAAARAMDLELLESCFTADAVWHLPGRSPISGDHRGWSEIRDDFLSKLAPLSGETFRADLIDVAVGGDYVVAVQHATADYQGRRLDITACQLMSLEGGRIAEVQGHYSDQYALDAFWQDE